jgi:chromosome segregation ATPase
MAQLTEFHVAFVALSEELGNSVKQRKELDSENRRLLSTINSSRRDVRGYELREEEWRIWHAHSLAAALLQRDGAHEGTTHAQDEAVQQLHAEMRSCRKEASQLRANIQSFLKTAAVEQDRLRAQKEVERVEAQRQREKRKEVQQMAQSLLRDNGVIQQRHRAAEKKIDHLGEELDYVRTSKNRECKRLRSMRDEEEEYGNRQRKKRRDAENKIQELTRETLRSGRSPRSMNESAQPSWAGELAPLEASRINLLPRATVASGEEAAEWDKLPPWRISAW